MISTHTHIKAAAYATRFYMKSICRRYCIGGVSRSIVATLLPPPPYSYGGALRQQLVRRLTNSSRPSIPLLLEVESWRPGAGACC